MVSGRDNSLTAVGKDRVDVVGVPKLPTDRSRSTLIAQYFNKAMFRANTPGNYGNSSRNILIGPRYANVDFGMAKIIHLYERHQL